MVSYYVVAQAIKIILGKGAINKCKISDRLRSQKIPGMSNATSARILQNHTQAPKTLVIQMTCKLSNRKKAVKWPQDEGLQLFPSPTR